MAVTEPPPRGPAARSPAGRPAGERQAARKIGHFVLARQHFMTDVTAAGLRGPLVLVLASLVLALAGTILAVAASQVRASPAVANRALTDQQATRQVRAAVTTELDAVFSYSSADLGVTQRAAQRDLAGQAAAQYRELLPVLLQGAAAQHLTVVSRVVSSGVSSLSGNTAQVLVFIDQTATREDNKPSSARAQLAVTVQLRGGRWLITGIEAR